VKRARSVALIALFTLLASVSVLQAQGLPQASPEEVGLSSERLGRLTRMLQEYIDAERLPGVAVMVLRDGKVAFSEALGWRDVEAGSPMAEDAIFRIASQSKAVVSVAVMILQEEGALLISDPVAKYLPAFQDHRVAVAQEGGGFDIVEGERPITLRDLLTHTAGIGYGYGPGRRAWEEAGIQGWYFGHYDEPIRVIVDHMAGLPFDAQPGKEFVYGYNTDILGAVVEEVSRL